MSSDLFFIVSSRAFTLVCHVINILLHTALVRSIGMQQAAKLKRQEWSGDLRRSSPVGLRSDGVETPPLLDATSYLPEQISYTDALRCLSCCGMIGYSLLVTLVVWITPYILSWAGTFPVRPTRQTRTHNPSPLSRTPPLVEQTSMIKLLAVWVVAAGIARSILSFGYRSASEKAAAEAAARHTGATSPSRDGSSPPSRRRNSPVGTPRSATPESVRRNSPVGLEALRRNSPVGLGAKSVVEHLRQEQGERPPPPTHSRSGSQGGARKELV